MSEQIKALIRTLAEDACKARGIELDSEGLTKLTEHAYGAMGDAFYKAVRKLEPKGAEQPAAEAEGPPWVEVKPDAPEPDEPESAPEHKRKGKKG